MATTLIVWFYLAGTIPAAWALLDWEPPKPFGDGRWATLAAIVCWPVAVVMVAGEALVDYIVRKLP